MKRKVTVLILCGGKGERLRPLTESTPKPLIHINDRPILSYLLDYIQKFEITDIVVAVGFKAEKIKTYFKNKYTDLNITIVDSGDVDIIDRIKSCSHYINDDFILLYGDTLADVNFNKLQEYHYSHNLDATITLLPLKSQFGLVELDCESNITSFEEKPTLNHWINIGNFYYDKKILSQMKNYSSYARFLEDMGLEKKMKGYKHDGVHITVNTLRELEDAEQNIHEFE